MAYSINLTDAQKTEVTKLIAESASTDDTVTGWLSRHLTTTLETSMRARLNEDIDKNWPDREEKKEGGEGGGGGRREKYVKSDRDILHKTAPIKAILH